MDIVSYVPRLWRPPVLLILLLCIVSAGCAKEVPKGTVKGTVTLDGKPYSDAAVVLMDLKTGQAGVADIQPGGSFALEAPLPVGKYTVYLSAKSADNASEEATPVKMSGSAPDKYYNEAESDITVDVVEGENNVEVPLKSG